MALITITTLSWPRLCWDQTQREIINRLGMLRSHLEFFSGRISLGEIVGITIFSSIRCENGGALDEFIEPGFELGRLQSQLPDVMRFIRRDAARNQEGFNRLFRRLLTMIDRGIKRSFFRHAEETSAFQIARRFG